MRTIRTALCLLFPVLAFAAGSSVQVRAQTQPPALRGAQPGWLMAGTTTRVRVVGSDLPQGSVVSKSPGITVRLLSMEAPNGDWEKQRGNRVAVLEITTPPSAQATTCAFELEGEGRRISGTLLVDVPAPEVLEKEPNNSLAAAMPLPEGALTVVGKMEDPCDVFRFAGKAGTRLRLELLARRLTPPSRLEGVLRLRDPRRGLLRSSVDLGADCSLECVLPEDGDYLIEVMDGENRTSGEHTYRLAVRPGPA